MQSEDVILLCIIYWPLTMIKIIQHWSFWYKSFRQHQQINRYLLSYWDLHVHVIWPKVSYIWRATCVEFNKHFNVFYLNIGKWTSRTFLATTSAVQRLQQGQVVIYNITLVILKMPYKSIGQEISIYLLLLLAK